jgi:uncharacterized delta-60 repeat protein
VRLNTDGSLDTTFGSSGGQIVAFDLGGTDQDVATELALQSDGKIVVVGWVERGRAGDSDMAVVRLDTNGSPDHTFSGDGKTVVVFDLGGRYADTASSVAIQPDGKILVAGGAEAAPDYDVDFAVARLNADGTLDASFDGDGKAIVAFDEGGDNYDYASDLLLQADGKIVLAGGVRTASLAADYGVARLLPSGALDTGFGAQGTTTIQFSAFPERMDLAFAVALQADGKLVVGGTVYHTLEDTDIGVARLLPNGSLDSTFGSGGTATVAFDLGQDNQDDCVDMVLQGDGKIVCVGEVQRLQPGDSDFGIARLTNGS